MEVVNKEGEVDKENIVEEKEIMDYQKQNKESGKLMFFFGAFLGKLDKSYSIIPPYLLISKNLELIKTLAITLDNMQYQIYRYEYVCKKYKKDNLSLEDIKKKMEITELECEDSLEYVFTFSIMKNNEKLLISNHNNIDIIKYNNRIKIEDKIDSCEKFYKSFIDLKIMISDLLDHMHKTKATNFFGMEECLKKLKNDFIDKLDKEFQLLNKLLEMKQAFNVDTKKYLKLCDCDLSTNSITSILNSN